MSLRDTSRLWKANDWRHSAWIALVTMVTGIVLAFLAKQTPLEAAWKRMVTRTYLPIATASYPATGQNAVTIVTVDDLDLDIFGVSWPLRFDFMARRLQTILALAPQALFVDLFLKAEGQPHEIAALREVLCRHARQTNIYVATAGGPDSYSETEKRLFAATIPLDPDAQPGSDVPTLRCAWPVDVRLDPDELDQLQWKYPMQGDGRDGGDGTQTPSAALAIFCRQFKDQCPAAPHRPLALVWPTTSAKSNVETMIQPRPPGAPPGAGTASEPSYDLLCRNGTLTHELRILAPDMLDFLWSRKGDADESKLLPCPYSRVVSLRAFNGYGFKVSELRGAIAGKIVMLGAQIAGSGDTIVSPINGRLPGVHAHAMALDNLISFEGLYKEYGEVDIHEPLSRANLFVVFSIVLIVAILTLWHHFFTPRPVSRAPAEPRKIKGNRRLLDQTLIVVVGLYMVIRGRRFVKPALTTRFASVTRGSFALVQGGLIAGLFTMGYVWLRQGPLSIAEYVLFPLFAQLTDMGKPIALRALELVKALRDDDPIQSWHERFDRLKEEDKRNG